jgi:hypothetical protein
MLKSFSIIFVDAFFSVIGFGAHLLDDVMVYDETYLFLWPFSTNNQDLELFPDVISSEGYYMERFF